MVYYGRPTRWRDYIGHRATLSGSTASSSRAPTHSRLEADDRLKNCAQEQYRDTDALPEEPEGALEEMAGTR